MEGKEERILIAVRHTSKELNMSFTDMFKDYTRQEAIERMAKAIYEFCRAHKPEGYLWYPRNNKVKDTYRACAEAALNALLGDK